MDDFQDKEWELAAGEGLWRINVENGEERRGEERRREMDDRGGGSFVAVRRISQGLERGNTCHSTSGEYYL